ncbi:MAG: orotate phosphoribosyltransferase [Flavobacteriales bacterium]|nr:orotate phosphoribosyltransferase [Flavobacteriales bacterium]
MQNIKNSQQVAEILLDINAVKLQPFNFFTWASGKKSPIYCDNRIILSHIKEREKIRDLLCESILKNISQINCIAGVATGAIAHGMLIADKLEQPFVYIRSKAKNYGRENQIEGDLPNKSKVAIIEDLISTGGSSMNAIKALEKANAKPVGLFSIFTYGFFNQENLSIPCYSLCDFKTLINVAISKKMIEKESEEILFQWQKKQQSI